MRGVEQIPWLYDLYMGMVDRFGFGRWRRWVVSGARGRTLEVGCGTGRLLLEYLADGLDVDRIDNSPEMLEICAEKARQSSLTVNLYAQGMEQLDLPRQYRTIFAPSCSFQLHNGQETISGQRSFLISSNDVVRAGHDHRVHTDGGRRQMTVCFIIYVAKSERK